MFESKIVLHPFTCIYLKVKSSRFSSGTLLRRACGSANQRPVDTSDSFAYIRFHSNAQTNLVGFKINYAASVEGWSQKDFDCVTLLFYLVFYLVLKDLLFTILPKCKNVDHLHSGTVKMCSLCQTDWFLRNGQTSHMATANRYTDQQNVNISSCKTDLSLYFQSVAANWQPPSAPSPVPTTRASTHTLASVAGSSASWTAVVCPWPSMTWISSRRMDLSVSRTMSM